MDDMVYICTKMARQMEAQGMDSMFKAAKTATVLMEDAKPLLEKVGLPACTSFLFLPSPFRPSL